MSAPTTSIRTPAGAQAPARRGSRRELGARTAWLFAAPGLFVYLAFLVYPALQSLWLSFTSWDGISPDKPFAGLANYAKLLDDPIVSLAVRNNVLWTVVTIVVPMALGLALALALNSRGRGTRFFRTLFYAPAVLPLVSIGTIWGWLYQPDNGAINAALRAVGLDALAHGWLGDNDTALWAVMVPAIWVRTGFPLLLYLAALQNVPAELYESADTDGATTWQAFWHITMPSLRPTHYILLALSLIESFKVFDLIYAMTYGGPGQRTQVLGTWMYVNVFQYYDVGYGTAIAVVITLVAIAVGIPYVRSQTKD